MNTQQIQAEKLDLIGWIYNIQDITIIERIKSIQRNIVVDKYEASLSPMSKQELVDRAKEANKAIDNNDIITQDRLEKEIQRFY